MNNSNNSKLIITSLKVDASEQECLTLINNLKQIKPGQTFNDYKHLCSFLKIYPTTGNTKLKQLEIIETFITFKREGNKYIVLTTDFSNLNLTNLIILTRRESNPSFWVDQLGELILTFIESSFNPNQDVSYTFFTTTEAIELFGFCNPSYSLLPTQGGLAFLIDKEPSPRQEDLACKELSTKITQKNTSFSNLIDKPSSRKSKLEIKPKRELTTQQLAELIHTSYWAFVDYKLRIVLSSLDRKSYLTYQHTYCTLDKKGTPTRLTDDQCVKIKELTQELLLTYNLESLQHAFLSPKGKDFFSERLRLIRSSTGDSARKGHYIGCTPRLLEIAKSRKSFQHDLSRPIININTRSRSDFLNLLIGKGVSLEEKELVVILDRILKVEVKEVLMGLCGEKGLLRSFL